MMRNDREWALHQQAQLNPPTIDCPAWGLIDDTPAWAKPAPKRKPQALPTRPTLLQRALRRFTQP